MTFVFNKKGSVPYSKTEMKALRALSDQPISTHQLVRQIYKGNPPFHARVTIVGIIRSLMLKSETNKESFIIKKSGRNGPKPMEVWVEMGEEK